MKQHISKIGYEWHWMWIFDDEKVMMLGCCKTCMGCHEAGTGGCHVSWWCDIVTLHRMLPRTPWWDMDIVKWEEIILVAVSSSQQTPYMIHTMGWNLRLEGRTLCCHQSSYDLVISAGSFKHHLLHDIQYAAQLLTTHVTSLVFLSLCWSLCWAWVWWGERCHSSHPTPQLGMQDTVSNVCQYSHIQQSGIQCDYQQKSILISGNADCLSISKITTICKWK